MSKEVTVLWLFVLALWALVECTKAWRRQVGRRRGFETFVYDDSAKEEEDAEG